MTDSRPVCLGVGLPSGTPDQFFFLLEIFFRHLRVCYFVAPSLTRGLVHNLLLLLVLASSVPRDSRSYFIVPIFETPNQPGYQLIKVERIGGRGLRLLPLARCSSLPGQSGEPVGSKYRVGVCKGRFEETCVFGRQEGRPEPSG
jgi:hypothetical protein